VLARVELRNCLVKRDWPSASGRFDRLSTFRHKSRKCHTLRPAYICQVRLWDWQAFENLALPWSELPAPLLRAHKRHVRVRFDKDLIKRLMNLLDGNDA
jgi:hypothetical protein